MSGRTASKTEQQKQQGKSEPQSREVSEQKKMSGAYAEILTLQQSAGNQAVNALMQGAIPSMVQSVINSSGQPIERKVRAQMESRFGHDFSDVRVHADTRAMASADALDAKAYTVGRDLVFGDGSYRPETRSGALLLAHELTHVVQQRRGGPAPPLVSNAAHERSADTAAKAATTGNSTATVSVSGATGIGIARKPRDDDDRKRREKNLRRQDMRDVQSEDREHEDVDGGKRQDRAEKRSRGEQRSAGQRRERQLEKSELEGEVSSAGRAGRKLRKAEATALSPSGHRRSHASKLRILRQVQQSREILTETMSPVDVLPSKEETKQKGKEQAGKKSPKKKQSEKSKQKAFNLALNKRQGKITEGLFAPRRPGVRLQQKYRAGTIATSQHDLPPGKSHFAQPDWSEGGLHTNMKAPIRNKSINQAVNDAREHRLQAQSNLTYNLPKDDKIKIQYPDVPSPEHQQAIKKELFKKGGAEQVQFGTAVHEKPKPSAASPPGGPESGPKPKLPKGGKHSKRGAKAKGSAETSEAAAAKPAKKPRRKKTTSSTKGSGPGAAPAGDVGTKLPKHSQKGPPGKESDTKVKQTQGRTGGAAPYTDTHGDVQVKTQTSTKNKPPVKHGASTKASTDSYPQNRNTARSADMEETQRVKAEKARPPTSKAERPSTDKHPHSSETKYSGGSSKARSPLTSSGTSPAKPSAPAGPSASAATKSPSPPAAPSAQAPKAQASSGKAQPPKAAAPPASNLHAAGATSQKPQTPQSKSGAAPKLGTQRPGQPSATGKQAAPPAKAQVKQPATAPKPSGAAKDGGAPAARRGPVINTTARPDGSVTAEVREKPGTSPTRYEVTVKVMLGGSANVSASQSGKRGSIGAHAGVSGSLTWSNTYEFSEEQKNSYLAAVNGDTASPYQEIEAAKAWSKGNREQAKSILSQLGGQQPSAQDILNMPEGSSSSFQADTRAEGGVNASAKAVSVGVSGSVSTQNGWRNEHREGRYFLSRSFTVEKGKSFDAAAGPGLWSMGYRADSSTTHTTTANFEVKDDDSEVRAKITAITSAHSMDDLGKLALSRKDLGGSLTVTTGTSSGGTIKVGAADDKVALEMGEEGFKSDSVTRDAEGNESHTFEGGSQDSMKFRFKGHEGPGVANRSSIRTTVDPHGKASGETLGENTETDVTASLKQAASHPFATGQAGARGDTQAIVKKSTDIKGMNLQDQNYDRLAQLSERADLWSKEGSYFGPKDYVAWMKLRPSIEKAHGNREVIAKLLQNFKTQGDDRRRQMLEGAMDVGEGTRFEFPNVMKDQKEVFDRLVVQNPMGRAAELAAEGKNDEALADLKRVSGELDALTLKVQSHRGEIDASVLGEMLSRISARRSEVRSEMTGLTPQAVPKTGAGDATTDAVNAQAEETRKREAERERAVADIKDIASTIKMFQQEEQELFAFIEQELNPKSEGFFGGLKAAVHTADTPLITTKLNQLKKLYNEKWDHQLTKLTDALKKAGLNPDAANNGKPNWDKWNALNKEASRLNR